VKVVKRRMVVVVAAMMVLMLGLTFGSSARNPIYGIEGVEFGAQDNLCLLSPEVNLGIIPGRSGRPFFWIGLTAVEIECQDILIGSYFKIGIPGFDIIRGRYLTNQWSQWSQRGCFASCSYSEYWELKVKIPVCAPKNWFNAGTSCFFYVGLGAFSLNTDGCFDPRGGPLFGGIILYIDQSGSLGVWTECSYAGLEMGFSIGVW
jgi:hypothetical protein